MKTRIALVAVAAVALTLLTGCPKGGGAPTTQKDCVAAGGHWQKGDSHHQPFCQAPKGGTW